jgi:hypothetical protein
MPLLFNKAAAAANPFLSGALGSRIGGLAATARRLPALDRPEWRVFGVGALARRSLDRAS